MARSVADEKQYLRAILTDCRIAISSESARAWSAEIVRRILAADFYRGAGRVVAYASAHNEVSTDSLIAAALAAGKSVMLPRYDRARGRFEPAYVSEPHALAPGAFGILEPPPAAPAAAANELAGALVCVPGLGFGLSGERLGRGGGHYDRFLAEFCAEAVTTGLAYSFQLLERIPEREFDRRLNFIVTESAVYCAGDAPRHPRGAAGQGGTPGWLC
ncbi:MAG TPA: 5-formyltetrahydrofolate cyclo-ligase [Candidatus Binataceae bacterium]|nr:5-formyltetrahydrofolate cyclo-ligase [Candidatus Binataceae bacterium]